MVAVVARFARFTAMVWLLLTVAFAVVYLLPGDPARLILGNRATPETLAAFRSQAGLDRPLADQYGLFLKRAIHGDFGQSISLRRDVTQVIAERSIATLWLAGTAFLLTLLFGLAIPLLLQVRESILVRRTYAFVLLVAGVAPPYVVGVVALSVLAGLLRWISPYPEGQAWYWWLVPAGVLAAYPAAVTHRVFDEQLAGALGSPYVLRAKALGATFFHVVTAEALPNILPPTLASVANGTASFLTGTLFVEVIFGIPGLGRLAYDAIRTNDLALLAPLLLVFAVGTSSLAMALDLILFIVDPRFRRRHNV
jgi:ABC-type dipeptide/oligopeptide/nickel transport system permease component